MLINIYKDIEADILRTQNIKGHITFVFSSLKSANNKIVSNLDIYNFTELLNTFISNQLMISQEYEGSGFISKIFTKKKVVYLLIEVKDKKYYFEKYEARVISQKINKILSKCTIKEFL